MTSAKESSLWKLEISRTVPSTLRPGSNVERYMRRTKLQFESTQMVKARPLGQTSNMIRRTKNESFNQRDLFIKFDS